MLKSEEKNWRLGSSWPNNTHTHPFNGPFSGTTWVSQYQKGKPTWISLKRETVSGSGSGISWVVCKSAPCSRQITTPGPHHSHFLQAGCPSCHPTNIIKALRESLGQTNYAEICILVTKYILKRNKIQSTNYMPCISLRN